MADATLRADPATAQQLSAPTRHHGGQGPALRPLGSRRRDDSRRVAARTGATPGQVALAWLLSRGPFVAPIPGTTRLDHFEENQGVPEAGVEGLVRFPRAILDTTAFGAGDSRGMSDRFDEPMYAVE